MAHQTLLLEEGTDDDPRVFLRAPKTSEIRSVSDLFPRSSSSRASSARVSSPRATTDATSRPRDRPRALESARASRKTTHSRRMRRRSRASFGDLGAFASPSRARASRAGVQTHLSDLFFLVVFSGVDAHGVVVVVDAHGDPACARMTSARAGCGKRLARARVFYSATTTITVESSRIKG